MVLHVKWKEASQSNASTTRVSHISVWDGSILLSRVIGRGNADNSFIVSHADSLVISSVECLKEEVDLTYLT